MTLRGLAAATGLALVVALGSARSVAACSMLFPPSDEVLAEADLILEGEITAVDGTRLTVDVTEVYRGDVSIGPTELGSTGETTACRIGVEPGQTIIVATDSLAELSIAGVWWVLDDGTLATLAPEPPAATAEQFRATLRGLPDTATLSPSGDLTLIGLIFLASGTGLAVARVGDRRQKQADGG